MSVFREWTQSVVCFKVTICLLVTSVIQFSSWIPEIYTLVRPQTFKLYSAVSDTTRAEDCGNNKIGIWGVYLKSMQLHWDKHILMLWQVRQRKVTTPDWYKFHTSGCWGRTVKDHHCQPSAAATSVMCLQLILILLKCNVPAEVSDHERTLESDPDLLGPQLNDYASLRRVTWILISMSCCVSFTAIQKGI